MLQWRQVSSLTIYAATMVRSIYAMYRLHLASDDQLRHMVRKSVPISEG